MGEGMGQEQDTPESAGGNRWSRWVAVTSVVALVVAAIAFLAGGDGGGQVDNRAATLALSAGELAPGGEANKLVRVNPPIDVGTVERTAKAATLGQAPLPDSRHVSSYQRTDTGEQITEAVLVYDNVEAAASLDDVASPLIQSALGLQPGPLDLPGTQDARRWVGNGVQVATFRVDGVVLVVSTTSTDPSVLDDLAAQARDKAAAAPALSGHGGE